MTVTFDEAVFGAEKEISIRKDVTCHTCDGEGAKPGTNKKHVLTVMVLVMYQLNKTQSLVE